MILLLPGAQHYLQSVKCIIKARTDIYLQVKSKTKIEMKTFNALITKY